MQSQVHEPEVWAESLNSYITWMRAAGRPMSTIKIRHYQLRSFAVSCGVAPFDVNLQAMVDHLSTSRWGPHTRRSVRGALRSFYSWAHLTGRAPSNPAEMLPPVTTHPGRPRPASETAIAVGMAHPDPRTVLMIRLGATMGLRCCEIATVSTDDLSGPRGGKTLLVHGKGNKKRVIPIADDLAQALEDRGPGFVFPGSIDGHLSSSWVSKLISRALPADTTAHPLRHRFATRAYRGTGGDIRAVQELLGHASVATTQIYTAVDSEALRRGVEAAA